MCGSGKAGSKTDGQILAAVRVGLQTDLGAPVAEIEVDRTIRRHSSTVMACRVRFADGEQRAIWVKVLHGLGEAVRENVNRTQRDFHLSGFLCERLGRNGMLRVPRVLHCSATDRLIVTEHVPGERLQNQLQALPMIRGRQAAGERLRESFRRSGVWLRAFQDVTEGFCPGGGTTAEPVQAKGLGRITEQTRERLWAAADADPVVLSPARVERLVAYLERLYADAISREAPHCAVHGDFFPGNLLVGTDTVAGIDFSSATWGSRFFDLGYFVFQVETFFQLKPLASGLARDLVDEFLRGFGLQQRAETFWASSPEMRLVFMSLGASRLLALTHQRPGKAWYKRRYRAIAARRLSRRLVSLADDVTLT